MFKQTFVTAIAALCVFVVAVEAGRFTLYEHPNQHGKAHTFSDGDYECHNLPGSFNDIGSSVDTHYGCVALFEHANCGGRRVIFKINCGGPECCVHADFGFCDFHDQASSYAMC
uniref:Beta/gamma crystallin 'Greek key' domain-containing protein n=1 Tax=Panagrellus redivivus TaxID=6233 RepID=A0A7E4ZV28_PANRE